MENADNRTRTQQLLSGVLRAKSLKKLLQPLQHSVLQGVRLASPALEWGETQGLPMSQHPFQDSQLSCFWKNETDPQLQAEWVESLSLALELWLHAREQRKQHRQQRQELLGALQRLRHTQEELVASEKTASLTGLVTGMAHELNTPLGVGITAITSLQDDLNALRAQLNSQLTEELQEYLEDLQSAAQLVFKQLQRSGELVERFKRISVDQLAELKREVELKPYIEDIIASLAPEFKRIKASVELSCPEDLSYTTYPGALAQILTQLLLNSIQHGFQNPTESPRVRIDLSIESHSSEGIDALLDLMDQRLARGGETRPDEEAPENRQLEKIQVIKLIYQDNGMGVPEKLSDRIMEPFITRLKSKYTGLGLYMAYNLASQKLRGDLRYLPQEQGVCFELMLPLNQISSK